MNKKQSKQSKMTLEKLALMMGKGFNEVNVKFREVHQRIDSLDENFSNKFVEVDKRFDEMDKKFDEVLNTQDNILKRLDNLETDNTMDMAFRDRFNALEKRVETVEIKMRIK